MNRRAPAKASDNDSKKGGEAGLSKRAEAARAKLRAAAESELGRVGYHGLRVTEVTRAAGVATGLFYRYFDNLKSLVVEVLEDFLAELQAVEAIEKDVPKGDWFARILAHHRTVVGSYAEHPGLMRCLIQVSDDDPEIRALWEQAQVMQLDLLIRALPKVFPGSQLNDAQARLFVMGLSGIGEKVLRARYIDRSPAVVELGLDEEEMAEWLAVLFYRGLFATNPPAEKIRFADRILQLQ